MNIVDELLKNKRLGIYIITYNRAGYLEKTLDYISKSSISVFPITVIDNCSTDNTIEIVNEFSDKFACLSVRTNRYNVGPNVNFLKAFEFSEFTYTWVLCDDDLIEQSEINDVCEVILEGKVDLIHVGAHPQKSWSFGGKCLSVNELLREGYPYFRFASFMPCNIFKTASFLRNIVPAYNNVGNAYPHMPYVFNLYLNNEKIYLSKNQLIIAQPSDNGYSPEKWFIWWMKTCELFLDKKNVRLAYLDQWKDIGELSDERGLQNFVYARDLLNNNDYLKYFEEQYFTIVDKYYIKKYAKFVKRKNFKLKVYLYETFVALKNIFV